LSKADPRIEAYGTVDELNAALGLARALDVDRTLEGVLDAHQRRLFQLGAELACTDPAALAKLQRVRDDDVAAVESVIDRLERDLTPLTRFIVPGGTALAAQLHVARTVCRRAERRVVTLVEASGVEPRLVRYLNRLADLLFVMARWANARAGVADVEWRTDLDTSS
jgi:cob(I)alamin adenosyltransferase